jgi:hypothetical protein
LTSEQADEHAQRFVAMIGSRTIVAFHADVVDDCAPLKIAS